MESLSDFLSRNPPPRSNGPLDQRTDFMNLHKRKPSSESGHTAEYGRTIDGLVRGLVELLPKPGDTWRLEDRTKWLRLAVDIFDLGYKFGEGESGEISIVAIKQLAPSPQSPVQKAAESG
jgi:hypothetical protein